jgi:hypothetical protein
MKLANIIGGVVAALLVVGVVLAPLLGLAQPVTPSYQGNTPVSGSTVVSTGALAGFFASDNGGVGPCSTSGIGYGFGSPSAPQIERTTGLAYNSGTLAFCLNGTKWGDFNSGTGAFEPQGGIVAPSGQSITSGQALFFNPGTSTGITGRAMGRLTADGATNGNGADTTEDTLKTFSVPAGAVSNTVTGVLHVHAWGDNNGISTTDVMTVRCYFGATVVASRVLTASQANTWDIDFEVIATGATTQVAEAVILQGGTTTFVGATQTTPAETVSGAITVKCTGQRATTSSANSVRQLGWIVEAKS